MFETNHTCAQQTLFCVFSQDDMFVRVFNYNTLEKVNMFEAHSDYIRCILVHPTQPYILSSSGQQPPSPTNCPLS